MHEAEVVYLTSLINLLNADAEAVPAKIAAAGPPTPVLQDLHAARTTPKKRQAALKGLQAQIKDLKAEIKDLKAEIEKNNDHPAGQLSMVC